MELLLPLAALLLTTAIFIIWYLIQSRCGSKAATRETVSDYKSFLDPYQDIEPCEDQHPQCAPPLRIRPFKPKFHLTMALENIRLSDLIAMDNTYQDRAKLRRSLMSDHSEATLACNSEAEAAVLELYDWTVNTYLPKRFSGQYVPSSSLASVDEKAAGSYVLNTILNERIPSRPRSPMHALQILGVHIDTDFLILLPSSRAADGSPIYHLQAFVTCFPSGFSTREKCGKPLAEIHQPVPGYASKLERSMDRFFAKLECGRAVKRHNWAITTNDKLFVETGNHFYKDEVPAAKNEKTLDVHSPDLDQDIEKQRQDVVIGDCRLRTERQTLHRLPNTKALVFAFKTYQYKLADVKAEGSGLALADAIDGLPTGSVPEMNFYKRGVVWGDKVVEYLRS